MNKQKPRETPDRDSKYMGLAWLYASFSKDPNTHVGAQIISHDNNPLGSGYNGPAKNLPDNLMIWDRPSKENPEELSKYDFMVHAEINAIEHTQGADLTDATLYVTALPCSKCMLEIARKKIKRIVYFDFKSHKESILQKHSYKEKTLEIASRHGVQIEEFKGSLLWMPDWIEALKELSVIEM